MSKKTFKPNWLDLPPGCTSGKPPRPQRDYTDISALLANARKQQRQQAHAHQKQHGAELHALIVMMGERFGRMGLSVDHATAAAMLAGTGLALEAAA